MQVSILIPHTPAHQSVVQQAIESARNQTVETAILVASDTEQRGAGYARNRLLEQADTPFVIFLDADDRIEQTFVEKCLLSYNKNVGSYVYTDWVEHLSNGMTRTVEASSRAWCAGTWHCITALIPTEWARAVGGFDESLPALEDTDFYMKISTRGGCGVRVPEPLFHYQANDEGRARTFVRTGQLEALKLKIKERYQDMGAPCCGGGVTQYNPPIGDKQQGDVLATIIPAGRMTRMGKVSGRNYPYSGPGDSVWVDPRDVAYEPQTWALVNGQSAALPKAPTAPSFTLRNSYTPPQPIIRQQPIEEDESMFTVSHDYNVHGEQTAFGVPTFEEAQQKFDEVRFQPAVNAATRQQNEVINAPAVPREDVEINVNLSKLAKRAKKNLGLGDANA